MLKGRQQHVVSCHSLGPICSSVLCLIYSQEIFASHDPYTGQSKINLLQQFIPLIPLSIVYDIATTVMNWYVLIFEMLRQEATHYKEKQCQDNSTRQELEMDIVQENALKLKRVLFNMMVLKT